MSEGRGSMGAAAALVLMTAWVTPILAQEPSPSLVNVARDAEGFLRITTPASEFAVFRSGAVRASLLRDGRHLTLDDVVAAGRTPGGPDPWLQGGSTGDLVLDWEHPMVAEASGPLGPRGKRVEWKGAKHGRSRGHRGSRSLRRPSHPGGANPRASGIPARGLSAWIGSSRSATA